VTNLISENLWKHHVTAFFLPFFDLIPILIQFGFHVAVHAHNPGMTSSAHNPRGTTAEYAFKLIHFSCSSPYFLVEKLPFEQEP
jgi:hypothetical protein